MENQNQNQYQNPQDNNSAVQQAVNQALDEQKKKKKKKRLIILAVIVGIIIIIAIAGSAGGGSDSSSGAQTTAGAASEATNSVATQEKEKRRAKLAIISARLNPRKSAITGKEKIPLKSPIISRIIHQKPKASMWLLKMMLIRMVSDLKALSLTAVQMNSAGMLRLSPAQQRKFQRFIF